MRRKFNKILFFYLLIIMGFNNLFAQSIGPNTGEIYLTLGWYYEFDDLLKTEYSAIIYSNSHGRTFEVLDTIVVINPEYFFDAGWVFADASPEVLYRSTGEELYRSMNQGETWEFLEGNPLYSAYATGNIENEIFRRSGSFLYKSIDNGTSWSQKNDTINGIILTGRNVGELFYYNSRNNGYDAPIEITLNHSLNDGVDFVSYHIDTTVTGVRLWDMSPRLYKGSLDGEFYLVSYWSGGIFKIFRSVDFGQSFTLQYEQEIPEFCHFLFFSAGRGNCEFYITIYQPLCMCSPGYARFTILHSIDCAQTFSEYYHEMTSVYSGEPTSVKHTISVEIEPINSGVVLGAGKYFEGNEVTLSAEPLSNFIFSHWSEEETIVSHESELVFTADKSRRIVANFESVNNVSFAVGENKVLIYPNPSNGIVTLLISNNLSYENTSIEIFNIQGQRIEIIPIYESKTIIDISSYQAGIYLYRLKRNNLYTKTGKLSIFK